jgi:hypothetical protein
MPAKNNMKRSSLARSKLDDGNLFRTAAQIADASGGHLSSTSIPPVSEKMFAQVRREAAHIPITINLETVRLAVLARRLEREMSSGEGWRPVFALA